MLLVWPLVTPLLPCVDRLTNFSTIGSIAAATQSAIYGPFTGGIFALLQSIGATAVVSIPALAGGLASAAAGVAAIFAA